MKKVIIHSFQAWLPVAASTICLSVLLFLALQQYIRLSANDLPTQYAEDTKSKLEKRTELSDIIKAFPETDLQKSLAPFVIIYDSKGLPLAGSGTLKGALPAPPAGVFPLRSAQGLE